MNNEFYPLTQVTLPIIQPVCIKTYLVVDAFEYKEGAEYLFTRYHSGRNRLYREHVRPMALTGGGGDE